MRKGDESQASLGSQILWLEMERMKKMIKRKRRATKNRKKSRQKNTLRIKGSLKINQGREAKYDGAKVLSNFCKIFTKHRHTYNSRKAPLCGYWGMVSPARPAYQSFVNGKRAERNLSGNYVLDT